ncbi:MAG: RNA polymerase sigma factor [Planctomycetes bacterium]|nr:RNA polymerase sigma factor [Planctomycetota bacterium]
MLDDRRTPSQDPRPGESRESAIPRLVEAHGDQLYSLGLRFCGDAELARDLVQDTFLLAFRKWDQFEGRARASTWLYTIAARVCQRQKRKRGRRTERTLSLEELSPFGENTVAAAPADQGLEELEQRASVLREVEQAIARLPVLFRMPLVLKEIAGLPLADISAVLGVRVETVKTRLHRARLAVRKEVESARPQRKAPPPIFDKQVCLDLLAAKQEALDHGVEFEFPEGIVCERCAAVFASLELAQDACSEVGRGELPAALRRAILEHVRGESGAKARARPTPRTSSSRAGTRTATRSPSRRRKGTRS